LYRIVLLFHAWPYVVWMTVNSFHVYISYQNLVSCFTVNVVDCLSSSVTSLIFRLGSYYFRLSIPVTFITVPPVPSCLLGQGGTSSPPRRLYVYCSDWRILGIYNLRHYVVIVHFHLHCKIVWSSGRNQRFCNLISITNYVINMENI